ncbi:glycosylhydrolase-like jelly roll fold domain-containing protein [Puia sp. P3]|uniref:glycosylhydrolase-like jelly roll fold domain-containing protein n=1 Tax=Puia sp. P3 TaxID=3423952 RepID=UPI003D666EB9
MPLKVLQKIAALVKAGATVVGPRPVEDSGLLDYPRCDEMLRELAAGLWGSGKVIEGVPVREVLARKNIRPDFEYTGEGVWLDFIHRSTADAEIYFITNRHGKAVESDCSFRITDHTPQLWDPVSGSVRKEINYRLVDGRLVVPLRFEAFQSWFVVFPKYSRYAPAKISDNFGERLIVSELGGGWDVAFDERWGGPGLVRFDKLSDWSLSSDPRIRYYSGKAVYSRHFEFTGGGPVWLGLGVVKDIARVILNGKDLGIVWTAPWDVELTPALKKGRNELTIEVINLWPNRLIGDAVLPPEKRLTNTNIELKKDAPLLPSGLLGPVTLQLAARDAR